MKILVVDDEEMIRSLVLRVLQRAGYEVTVAETGSLGLAALKADQHINIAVVDMTLTDTNGLDLIRQMRTVRPDLPCVVSTGQALSQQDVPDDIAAPVYLLPKPYRSQELVALVTRIAQSSTSHNKSVL